MVNSSFRGWFSGSSCRLKKSGAPFDWDTHHSTMYKILAQSFPNNEVRVTFSSTPGGRDPFLVAECSPVGSGADGIADYNLSRDDEPLPPLSLVPNSQSSRSGAGYGRLPDKPTNFGTNAKRQLLRQGGALEHHAPPEQCLFLTGTLPGSTEDAFRALAEWSGYIVHRLKSWIGNYAPEKFDFYCWEYQKRGALHLHYCVWIPGDADRSMVLDSFRDWWISILHRIGERTGTDMFRKNANKTWLDDLSKVRAVAEVCRKSPARYLAKYLSKSASPSRGSARAFSPSRWWGTSRPLKKACELLTQTIEIVEAGCQVVRKVWESVSHVCDSSESVTYSYRHKVGIGETYVCYPKSPEEKECLLSNLNSMKTMNNIASISPSSPPSQELKALKVAQIRFLGESLQSYPNISTGLRATLENLLRWTQALTPSTSPEPLSILLTWTARISDLASMCQYTPLWNHENRRLLDGWLNCLERNIERVADEGWH
jgi:hypothetical protein